MAQKDDAEMYEVTPCAPQDLSEDDLEGCLAIVKKGDAVDPESAEHKVGLAQKGNEWTGQRSCLSLWLKD